MTWPFHHKAETGYWLKVFAFYALTEASIQLLFFFLLNTFGKNSISIIEYHLVMWFFQCVLIWPIWWVAWSVRKKGLAIQVIVNLAFYGVYTYIWFGPVQDAIGYLYSEFIQVTRPPEERLQAYLDRGYEYSFLNYQLLKHAFRLAWFFLAAYFYNYRLEEKKRLELAIANKELQLRLLKWHLNPSFYFKTINHLRQVAADKPVNTTQPILQLAKVMEYVIYEAKEKLIDVKKEIHFLTNYIQLVNLQPGNDTVFEIDVNGEPGHLKIAPLLLTGFIDKILTDAQAGRKQECRIEIGFFGAEMQMKINGELGKRIPALIGPDDDLYKRLNEFYPDRFQVNMTQGGDTFNLNIRLDEDR
jgi:hypothetical protein